MIGASMTPEELAIWRAAYGAAMAIQYVPAEEHHRFHGTNARALAVPCPEVGIAAGDTAVRALRRWRERENAQAGVMLLDWTAPE